MYFCNARVDEWCNLECLLFHCSEILEHTELDGQIKVPCLGSLLPQNELKLLEEQYLTHKEVKSSRN